MGSRRLGSVSAAIAFLVALVVGAIAIVVPAAPAAAVPATPVQAPLPKAFVLVDADTGAVIAQQDDRTARLPASTIKLMTALIAVQRLKPGDGIPISPLAEGMPARKINVKAGQVWTFQDLLYSMMMVSANDAAVAIAEKIGGGTLDGYLRIADATAERLQLDDQPVFNDPAGLDDEFANKGGARISPRDLAIVSRAVLARPDLVNVINTPHYEFTGGDGIGHTLNNHDLFLDLYPGANGLKTGTTDLAGHTFVGSATRGGRTMLAIVFDAADYYGSAGALLDQGFNTPVAAEMTLDHLPPVVADASLPSPAARRGEGAGGVPVAPAAATVGPQSRADSSLVNSPLVAMVVLVLGLAGLVVLRRRTVVRRRRARALARRRAAQ
ncbi:MAG TPA: D-alanyl-D-alanine carboxypeptidase, partial [Acidimicrobiales bacterium]|nr:D-alanyl-D-alanine carboxypeptidase [Acidimicrobiales bacterium]